MPLIEVSPNRTVKRDDFVHALIDRFNAEFRILQTHSAELQKFQKPLLCATATDWEDEVRKKNIRGKVIEVMP